MSDWNPPDQMPDESVQQIFYHLGDGGTLLSHRNPRSETWPEFFKIMGTLKIKGWQPLVAPLAPQPPTQHQLDEMAMVEAYRGQGIDWAHATAGDVTYDFKTGWYLALQYARK